MKPLMLDPASDLGSPALFPRVASRNLTVAATSSGSVPRFSRESRALIAAAHDPTALRSTIAQCVREQQLAALLAWHFPGSGRIGESGRLEGLLAPVEGISPSLTRQLTDIAATATRTQDLVVQRLHAESGFQLVALPITGTADECLVAVIDEAASAGNAASSITERILRLQLLAAEAGVWFATRAAVAATELAQTTAELTELTARIQTASDSAAAGQLLVDVLQQHWHARDVFTGLCRPGQKDCRLTAISGGRTVNRLEPEARLIESALQESVSRSAAATWPPREATNRHALLAHQQLAESWPGALLLSVPLVNESGQAVGSVLLSFASTDEANAATIDAQLIAAGRFLRAASAPLAAAFDVVQRVADNRWLQWITRCRRQLTASHLQTAGWVASAAALVLLLPMTYTVSATAELQPAERRFVAAPFSGPLEECLVEPGDFVRKDQLLARMDGREIRWELAEIEASLNKAVRERNTQVSSREFGAAAISAQEVSRLEQRRALLQHRGASLEIRSPADGVVVSGDHREAEGVPLETGQSLFEIAPLEDMVIEVCIPESDVRHVTAGMAISMQPEARPERSLDAVIRCVHPRAELRDGENVFVAEADIANADLQLLPGMRGPARISTQRHPLGWNLFHKPAAWLLGWIGW